MAAGATSATVTISTTSAWSTSAGIAVWTSSISSISSFFSIFTSTATISTASSLSSISSPSVSISSPTFTSIASSISTTISTPVSTTSTSPVSTASTSGTSWCSGSPRSCNINLDLLSTDGGSVQHLLCLFSFLLCFICDESISLATVVGVGNIAKSLKFSLEIFLWSLGSNSVNKELASLLCEWGHLYLIWILTGGTNYNSILV